MKPVWDGRLYPTTAMRALYKAQQATAVVVFILTEGVLPFASAESRKVSLCTAARLWLNGRCNRPCNQPAPQPCSCHKRAVRENL